MAIEVERLLTDFRCLSPEEFVAAYAGGRRDFRGINLLREYLEALAQGIDAREYRPPTDHPRFGYWRESVSPLWVDRMRWQPPAELYDGSPVFHWESDAFEPLLERDWENQEEYPEVEVVDLEGVDLSEINLQGAYLHRVNLTAANLEGARLQRAILIDVALSGSNLRGADLREAVTSGVVFDGADITGARFDRARLQGADFRDAILRRVRFSKAVLDETIWRDADLTLARFSRNSLIRADLRGLDLTDVRLNDSIICGSRINSRQQRALLDALSIRRQ
jgi:uncharacterized protein YjbI with pentapeptide repeats